MTDKQAIRALFPGKTVMLDERVEAVVYPLGVPQIRRFTDQLVGPFQALFRTAAKFSPGGPLAGTQTDSQVGAQVIGMLVPHVVNGMTDILDECVEVRVWPLGADGSGERTAVKVGDLPHHYLPPIAEAWLEESFGDAKKREPWLNAVRAAWAMTTGEELSISEMLSRSASKLATAAETSST